MTPKLEARVKGAGGQLKLLNINIDKFGDVAKVFQVKAVPTIYLIYQGKAIDSFSGEISDELLGKFIETATRATIFDKGEVAVTKSIEEAQIALSQGDLAKTEKILIDLKTSHLKEEYGLVKDIFLAYVYAQLGKITNLKSLV
jgi:thioredoxin-like negative regulator of GroEL